MCFDRGTAIPLSLFARQRSTEDTHHTMHFNLEDTMPQYSDEQVLGYLRKILLSYRVQYPPDERAVQECRKSRRPIYPDQHHLLEQVLKENGRDYPDVVEQIAPETLFSDQQTEVKNETSAPTPIVRCSKKHRQW